MFEKELHRGNLMWEGSRMMLPEHVEAMQQYHRDKLKVPEPNPSPEDLHEMGIIAMESLHYEMMINVSFWKDGYIQEKTGMIEGVNEITKRVRFQGETIPFHHLNWIERM